MSSVKLLDKTRKIGLLLHNNDSTKVVFNDICKVLAQVLESNVIVITKKGKVIGSGKSIGVNELKSLVSMNIGSHVDDDFNDRLLAVLSTKENCNLGTLGFMIPSGKKYTGIISPIEIAGERFGTIFFYRENKEYEIDDIILAEYGTTVVGLEMMRSEYNEMEEDERRHESVKSAVATLTATERRSLLFVFDELENDEGLIVASHIADKAGITRSIFVNALKKLESAKVLETRSAGMRGTYVKITNTMIYDLINEK